MTVGSVDHLVGSEKLVITGIAAAYSSAAVGTYAGVIITYTIADGAAGGLGFGPRFGAP
mgnify:CR=1 FL=1